MVLQADGAGVMLADKGQDRAELRRFPVRTITGQQDRLVDRGGRCDQPSGDLPRDGLGIIGENLADELSQAGHRAAASYFTGICTGDRNSDE